jgi:hypothetical protein
MALSTGNVFLHDKRDGGLELVRSRLLKAPPSLTSQWKVRTPAGEIVMSCALVYSWDLPSR